MQRSLKDYVTIVITTSPVISHPSLGLLEKTLASFVHVPELHACPKIIVADGTRREPPEEGDTASPCGRDAVARACDGGGSIAARRKYANRAKAMRSGYVDGDYAARYGAMKAALSARVCGDAGKVWHPTEAPFSGVRLVYLEERLGYGFALRSALAYVSTRFVLVVQHDRTWMRPCVVSKVVDAMEASGGWALPDGVPARGGEPLVRCVSFVTRSTVNYIKRAQGRRMIRHLDVELERLVWRPPELGNETLPAGDSQPFLAPLLQFYDSTHIAYTDCKCGRFGGAQWKFPTTYLWTGMEQLCRPESIMSRHSDWISLFPFCAFCLDCSFYEQSIEILFSIPSSVLSLVVDLWKIGSAFL